MTPLEVCPVTGRSGFEPAEFSFHTRRQVLPNDRTPRLTGAASARGQFLPPAPQKSEDLGPKARSHADPTR
jgi:hypothetical protein